MADNKNKNNNEKGSGWLKSLFSPNNVSSLFKGLGSGVTGIIGSAINYGFQKRLADQTFAHQQAENEQVFQQNRLLAHEQNQFNLDQWNRENAYNSPAAQMARYHAAGLNPDLIYGQNNVAANSPNLVAGTPKSPSNYAESRASAVSAALSLQNVFAQNSLLRAQKENIDADTENKNADTENKQADTEGKNLSNAFNKETFEKRVLGVDLSNQTATQVIDNLIKEGKLLDTNRDKAIQEIENLKRNLDVLDQNIHESQARIENLNQDTRNKLIESDLLKKKIEETASIIYKNNAETEYYKQKGITESAVREQLHAMAKYYITNASLNEQQFEQNKIIFPIQVKQANAQVDNTLASTEKLKSEKKLVDKQESNYNKINTWNNVNGSVGALGSLFGGIGQIIPM